jgi:hypothetical protein
MEPFDFPRNHGGLAVSCAVLSQSRFKLSEAFLNALLDLVFESRKNFGDRDLKDDLVLEGDHEGGHRLESFVSGDRSLRVVPKNSAQLTLAQADPFPMNPHVVRQTLIRFFVFQKLCHATFFF